MYELALRSSNKIVALNKRSRQRFLSLLINDKDFLTTSGVYLARAKSI